MSQEIDIFSVYSDSENKVFKSKFVPLICFNNLQQKQLAESYILEQVEDFFKKLRQKDINIASNIPVSYKETITDLDFERESDNNYFYENIFYDLGERLSNGKLKESIKWCITFDSTLAPIKLKYTRKLQGFQNNPKDSELDFVRQFGTMDINEKPFLYYIHFTIQEILDEIKKL